jgi:hypothetical protein
MQWRLVQFQSYLLTFVCISMFLLAKYHDIASLNLIYEFTQTTNEQLFYRILVVQ